MDERTIDKAPSASLDMMALNKTVVNARSVVRKAKAQLINKLVRNVTDLKKKKGSESQKEKNLKKAQRFLEEIDSMRTLKDDKIFKYAAANVSKFEDVAKSTVSPAARAMARLADHRLVKDYVQKFRDEQSDWRDLAAFMLMKQTGRKFKSSKQKDKAKGKKDRKAIEKVNRAENVKASKLMTEVYTHGLFRDDEFQKAKDTLESDSKGELNFLEKRRIRIANEKIEKQKQKLLALQKKKSENSQVGSKVKDSVTDDGDKTEINHNGSESDVSEDDSDQDVLQKPKITKSKKANLSNIETVAGSMKSNDSDEDDTDEEEEMEVSNNETDDSEEESDESDSNEDDEEEPEAHKETKKIGRPMESKQNGRKNEMVEPLKNRKDTVEPLGSTKSNRKDTVEPLGSTKSNRKDTVEPLGSTKSNKKDTVEPLGSTKSNRKDTVEPLGSTKSNRKDTVEPLGSTKSNRKDKVEPLNSNRNSKKDTVEPLNSKKVVKRSKECVVKHLNIGSVSDESDAEESTDDEEIETVDEEEVKPSRRKKGSKPVPDFLTGDLPNPKKLPKDSFFEGGDVDSDSEGSDKESDDDGKASNDDDDSNELQGNRGKIKTLIYGAGRGRGRGRGRGGSNEGANRGRGGKKSFGRGRGGCGGDGPFSFGTKEVMYKSRNQTLITGEGKTKLVTEKKESKPNLHPSWEASRKRKAEESGGIKAFAGKRISFGDD